jgi:gluconokinase
MVNQERFAENTTIAIVMGVSGSGKTTVGQTLAAQLNWQFKDADDFHPPENREKMSRGIPLNDADRQPWLRAMRQAIATAIAQGQNLVLSCSALKVAHRQTLADDWDALKWIYLQGSFELIQARMNQRQNHFMPAELLQSQFDTLEPPDPQAALYVDAALPVTAIVQEIIANAIDIP